MPHTDQVLQQPDTVSPELKQRCFLTKMKIILFVNWIHAVSLVLNKNHKIGLPCLHPVTDLAAYLI